MKYQIHPNGIDGVTGGYLNYPTLPEDLLETFEQNLANMASAYSYPISQASGPQKTDSLGLPSSIDPSNLGKAGWAVVLSAEDEHVKSYLNLLIDHRRRSIPPDRCKILEYSKGEDVRSWLKRYGVSPGNVIPTKVPFYLLLIGSPTNIPFEFQYALSIEYAVGRLCFDKPEQYAQYALSITSFEKQSIRNEPEVCFWAPRHDEATELSADFLVRPLAEPDKYAGLENSVGESFIAENRCFIGEKATKQNLSEIFKSDSTPSMLFTASHGVGWPVGHPQQIEKQGALVCQDWSQRGAFDKSHYFAASDITDEAKVNGLIVFSFACYSAGTPAYDTFYSDSFLTAANSQRRSARIAEMPFVTALPQRILSHPNGSALAFIGHVDRAWSFSIKPPSVAEQLVPFRNCISTILNGIPVGLALRDFAQRYAVLSTALLNSLAASEPQGLTAEQAIWAWVERNDAQSYVILGDPAARV
jgi:hypothetical protein